MKPAIAVITRGTRSRSIPERISGTGVVAAINTEADTPSVPLARMVHAPHSPSTDRPRTRGPPPRKGRKTTNSRKGTSISIRTAKKRMGMPAAATSAATTAASTPNAQNASRGVATTASTKSTMAASCAGSRCSRLSPCR